MSPLSCSCTAASRTRSFGRRSSSSCRPVACRCWRRRTPLRGLAGDAEYIASVVNQIDGPVLLVAHSYGGAVITVAGAAADNVVGLVYVAAFILDDGESFGEVFAGFPDTPLLSAVRRGTTRCRTAERRSSCRSRPSSTGRRSRPT